MQSDGKRFTKRIEQSIKMSDGRICNSTWCFIIKREMNTTYCPIFEDEEWAWKGRNIFFLHSKETANEITEEGKQTLKEMAEKIKYNDKKDEVGEMFDAAELAALAMGIKPIPQEDYDRFWKWMETPLKDVPDEELLWCYKQNRQNSICSKAVWRSEIERRNLKTE